MRSKLDPRPTLTERLGLAVTEDQKRRLFAAAAEKDVPLSKFIRDCLAAAVGSGAAPDHQAGAGSI